MACTTATSLSAAYTYQRFSWDRGYMGSLEKFALRWGGSAGFRDLVLRPPLSDTTEPGAKSLAAGKVRRDVPWE